ALCRPGANTGTLQRSGVEWVAADLGAWKQIRDVMPPRVDAVFHAAYNISLWQGDAEEQTRLNVFGTRNLVRAALDTRAQRFIHSSSHVAYGLHGGIVTEETPSRASRSSLNLIRSMAQGEREVRRGIRQGLQAVIMNPAHMLGAHDEHGWGRILQLIQSRRVIGAAAGGGSFCHVRTVAETHVRAVRDGRPGHNYLLGGADLTYVKLLNLVGERLGRATLPWPVPARLLRGYASVEELLLPVFRRTPDITRGMIELLSAHSYCRSRKAMKELGYQPAPLEQMIEDCVDWLRRERSSRGT
ncbi:MAG: NAD-dependent epimerase/dehydratase family protein, partial [Nevskiales bacterium]